MKVIKSIFLWIGIIGLILWYVPILYFSKLFDKDPSHYKTGKRFRKLGKQMTSLNPFWKVILEGNINIDDRKPYIIVSNHLSNADIPVISNLPWEMKWVGKKSLFDIPILGKMMSWSMDISVDRKAADRLTATLKQVKHHIDNKASVIFFPEGTRSRNGKMNKFNDGAFAMAIRFGVPILPIVVDGTERALPKNEWIFRDHAEMRVRVLDEVDTSVYNKRQARELSAKVREMIASELASMRNLSIEEVDNMKQLS